MNRTQDSLEIIEDCIAEDLEDEPQPVLNEIVNFKVSPKNEDDVEPTTIRRNFVKKGNR